MFFSSFGVVIGVNEFEGRSWTPESESKMLRDQSSSRGLESYFSQFESRSRSRIDSRAVVRVRSQNWKEWYYFLFFLCPNGVEVENTQELESKSESKVLGNQNLSRELGVEFKQNAITSSMSP